MLHIEAPARAYLPAEQEEGQREDDPGGPEHPADICWHDVAPPVLYCPPGHVLGHAIPDPVEAV